jgi:hypothetical protein
MELDMRPTWERMSARSSAHTDMWRYRLGYDEARTTTDYTHVIEDDHKKVAEQESEIWKLS